MPTLRNRILKRPLLGLLLCAVIALFAAADATRPPQSQLAVKTYLLALDGYHHYIHPFTSRFIHCRYTPTCSGYSRQAVEKYGIVHGLSLTLKRVASCRSSVPLGTYDPVP